MSAGKIIAVVAVSVTLGLVACSSGSTSGGGQSSGSSGNQADSKDGGGQASSSGSSGSSGSPTDSGASRGSNDSGADAAVTYDYHLFNFDELAEGTTVTNQYATWATFSSDAGCSVSATSSAGVAASQPNYLWTYYSCATGPSASYFIDFAKPVRGFKVKIVGVNDTDRVATINLVKSDQSKTSHDVTGQGNYTVPVAVDLSSETDVVRVEIVNVNDSFGLGIDDVELDFPSSP